MARREITQYFDDLDNSPLTEAELNVVRFSVDGTDYTLDVSADNAARFRDALSPFLEAARIVPAAPRPRRRGGMSDANRTRTRQIRLWAQDRGIEVASRGKIPQHALGALHSVSQGMRKGRGDLLDERPPRPLLMPPHCL